MIAGVIAIVALVAFIEWLRSSLLDKTNLHDDTKALIVAITEATAVTACYIFLFRAYEKRRIHELSALKAGSNIILGFLTGIILQSLFILFICLFGNFSVVTINPFSTLLSPIAFALAAGFVAEIIIIGVVFRLLEEQTGTVIALIIFVILFAVLHINVKGATPVSVGATAMQAGFLLPAAYVFRRSLWIPVFLHFGWDVAEPGIFGGINPSSSLTQGLLTSKISGNPLLTGGVNGPQDSLSSLLLCLLAGIIFLLLAKRKNNLITPRWRMTGANKSIAAS